MKKPYIVCNWKMNPSTGKEADALAREMVSRVDKKRGELIIAPPALFIERVRNVYSVIGSQDISEFKQGSYTGQLSAQMMKKAGASYAIIGHAERKIYQKETDVQSAEKIKRAQEEHIVPIICVGEIKKTTVSHAWHSIKKQLDVLLPSIKKGSFYIYAYEPLWAIGGAQTVDPQYVADVVYRIKLYIRAQKQEIPTVIYGGSVNCENIDSLLYYKDTIDGFIVGSVSVKIKEIKNIIKKIYGSY